MNARRASALVSMLLAISLPSSCLLAADSTPRPEPTTLGIEGDRFTLNASPRFLLGISLYGALGEPEEALARDLDDLAAQGFNWIRVWATWSFRGDDVSAVAADGTAREPYLGKLQRLVAECDRRGLVVDVTLTRGKVTPEGGRIRDLEAHLRAVEVLLERLGPSRNWYLDLANERDIRDDRYVGMDELKTLRERVRKLDPRRLVTASSGGDIDRKAARRYLEEAQVDFVCPHRPRDADSPTKTEASARELRGWMREDGRVVPLHYQEPFRRGYGNWEPSAEDFLADLRAALAGGAAGWCLHNGDTRRAEDGRPARSFDLTKKRLLEQLDPVEMRVVREAAKVLDASKETEKAPRGAKAERAR